MTRPLVICGMHRSGTSLVGSVLQAAGLDIGRDIEGAYVGNPRGHFEDPDFHALHEAMLASAGCTWLTATGPVPAAERFAARARSLVEKRASLPLWGWKDPRTCLFLDFWNVLLPEANYLLIYRHPADVALSLLRRDAEPELRSDPMLAIRAWEVYDRLLLDFHLRYPDRCFLAQVPALTGDLAGFVSAVAERFSLPLRREGLAGIFHRDELAQPGGRRPAWKSVIPVAMELFSELEARTDSPPPRVAITAQTPDRHGQLENAAEAMFFSLLESRQQRAELEATVAELHTAVEAHHLREQSLEVRLRALAATLTEIEESRAFALVRSWWRLRQRVRTRPQATPGPRS